MTEKWKERFSRSDFNGIQNANASFKGVPFILRSSTTTFGRRLIPHEYPQKDTPFTEDMGRRVRIFNVTGAMLGADYLTDRDFLAFVCEEEGPGDLVHPYFGNLRVRCETLKFEDDIRIGRITNFEAIFIEVGELTFPIENPATGSAVSSRVDQVLTSLRAPFLEVYDITQEPLVFIQGKAEALGTAYDLITIAKSTVEVDEKYFRNLNTFKAQIDAIVTDGNQVFDSLVDLITFGLLDNENLDTTLNQSESFKGLNSLLTFKSGATPESQGSLAMDDLVQQVAVSTMALNTSQIDFVSATEAREFRNTILEKIDAITLSGTPDEVTQNFNDLRGVVVQDIDTRSINLPELKIIQPVRTLPSVVLSQELYGTGDKGTDISNRNNIEHPGFVPGGDDLEVLVSA